MKWLHGQALWLSPDTICQTVCKVTKGRHVTDGQLQEEMGRFEIVKSKFWSQQTIMHPEWEFQTSNGPLTSYLADCKSMKSRRMSAVA